MSNPADNLDALTSSLVQLAGAKSGDELLAFSIERVLASADPRKAEVLRRCAVPRWFDARVLGLLRDKEEQNEHYLARLNEYSFVRELGDGRLAYHDRVRAMLLGEWERERPAELRNLHLRLYDYFSRRTTPLGSTRRPLPTAVGSLVMSAVPLSAQADMWRREAVYHLLCADRERGLAELRATFDELEENHRLAEAELLLQVAAEAPGDSRLADWLTFLRARTHQAALNLEAAAADLQGLLARGGLDPELDAEAHCALGEVRAETGQWALATELYYRSLDYFKQSGNQRAVADTMMLLGEAYQNLGVSTGSWHVGSRSPHWWLNLPQQFFVWLLSLPFMLMALVLGRRNRALPIAERCAYYQNWLLIRLYNTARGWFVRARAAYADLQNESGMVRAEQRLADILLIYGHHGEAIEQVNRLLKRPLARDPYRRAWLKRSLAEGHLAAGEVGSAQVLLDAALQIFRELGDIRREAAILALQGKAAAMGRNDEGALQSYRSSLARFRTLRYAAARERILHELRAWRSDPQLNPDLAGRIDQIIADEPEKRYVGRFIRRYLFVLQIASLLALPLAAILLAMVVPITTVNQLAAGLFAQSTLYDPWRSLGALSLIVPIYLAVYAAIGAGVIFLLPLDRIEREQPDLIMTRPEAIARYNHRGELVRAMPWPSIARWLALDRCIWERPLPLYSRSFLEDKAGDELVIDGITGWYQYLQSDIGRRLAAAGSAVQRQNLGYRLIRSYSGLSVTIGFLLLPLMFASVNGWLPLIDLLPPALYGLLHMLTFSGVLILVPLADWLAYRPLRLQRMLHLKQRWTLIVGGMGLGTLGAYLLSGLTPVPELNMALFVWGVYLLIEALLALLSGLPAALRIGARSIALLATLALIAMPAFSRYQVVIAQTATRQASRAYAEGGGPNADSSAAARQASDAATQARASGGDPFNTTMLQGYAGMFAGDYQLAIASFDQAAQRAATPAEQALAYYNLALAYEKTGDRAGAWQAYQRYVNICNQRGMGSEPICQALATGDLGGRLEP